jgi:hypothetical protein
MPTHPPITYLRINYLIIYPPKCNTYLFTYLPTHLHGCITYLLTHTHTHTYLHTCITYLHIHPLAYLLTHLPTYPPTRLLTYLPTFILHSLVAKCWNEYVKLKNWQKLNTFWWCGPLVNNFVYHWGGQGFNF